MTRVEWYPAEGSMIAFTTGTSAALRLLRLDGIGPVDISPIAFRSPGQVGETVVDADVPARIVVLQGLIQTASLAALWPERARLTRALRVQPARANEDQPLGRLRVIRDGQAPLEVLALPRSVGLDQGPGNVGVLPFDVEWACPHPWWREASDTQLLFAADAGGFEWPIEFDDVDGFEMPSNNVEQEVINAGDVDAPIFVRFLGDCTNARILNVTTDETLEIEGQIEAGEVIEVNTEFGNKTVELISGGVRSNAMGRLDLSAADFWSLRPGRNVVRFEADVNVSGRAELRFRQRFSGI